jgi:hypothetical protein
MEMSKSTLNDYDPSIANGKDRIILFSGDHPICRVRLRSGHVINEEKILKANPELAKPIKKIRKRFLGFMGEVTVDFILSGKFPEVASISFYIPGTNGREPKFWIAWSKELEHLCWDMDLRRSGTIAEGRIQASDISSMDRSVIVMHQGRYYFKEATQKKD